MHSRAVAKLVLPLTAVFSPLTAAAQEQPGLWELFNPLSDLATAPLLITHDTGIGQNEDGKRSTIRLQPKSTFPLSRTGSLTLVGDFPYVDQTGVTGAGERQKGFGDVTLKLWYSDTSADQFSWGLGPVVAVPTGDQGITSDRWAAGLTLLGVYSSQRWTYGATLEHFWDLGGSGTRNVQKTSFAPYVAYHPGNSWNLSFGLLADYEWDPGELIAPVTFRVGRVMKIGTQRVNLGAGLGYWAKPSSIGPRGAQVSFLIQPLFGNKRR